MKVVGKDKLIYSYSRSHPPVETVALGETFGFETHERFSDAVNTEAVAALTGPVFVAGSEPGQWLRVDILDITFTQDFGVIVSSPGRGAFGDIHPTRSFSKCPIADGWVSFSSDIRVPLRPHVGRLAVAPRSGEYPTGTLGPFGGNMDNTHIRPGASAYLPIYVEGALLSLGDIHACMGEGESNLSGVEVCAIVTVRCSAARALEVEHPVVENSDEVMTTADGETFEEAASTALHEMACLLTRRLGLTAPKAAELISVAADLRVCQIVNPRIGVKVVISKQVVGEFLRQ